MKIFMLIISTLASVLCIMAFFHQGKSAGSPQNVSPSFGGITGHVFDAEGNPVADAEVFAQLADGTPLAGRRAETETDKDGKFFINNVKPGLNRVFALKPEDGYPDTSSAFYQAKSQEAPEIFVLAGQVIRGVIVRLGQKCEKLVGSVLDAGTNGPIKYAQITLHRTDNPAIYISFSTDAEGKFETLLPPIPTQIKATARGYAESRINIPSLIKSDRAKATLRNPNEVTILLRRVK